MLLRLPSLGKERLRTEEAEVARLSDENENLRYDNVAKTEEAAQLRQDAGRGLLSIAPVAL
eukprot:1081181-Amphidinium_carterae.1